MKSIKKLSKSVCALLNKRLPVIAGTGSNNTIEAIEFTNHAENCGADAALSSYPLL